MRLTDCDIKSRIPRRNPKSNAAICRRPAIRPISTCRRSAGGDEIGETSRTSRKSFIRPELFAPSYSLRVIRPELLAMSSASVERAGRFRLAPRYCRSAAAAISWCDVKRSIAGIRPHAPLHRLARHPRPYRVGGDLCSLSRRCPRSFCFRPGAG